MSTINTERSAFSYISHCFKPFYKLIGVLIIIELIDGLLMTYSAYNIKVFINLISNNSSAEISSIIVKPVAIFSSILISFRIINIVHEYIIDLKIIPPIKKNILTDEIKNSLNQDYEFYINNEAGKISHNIITLTKYLPLVLKVSLDFFGLFSFLFFSLYLLSQIHLKLLYLMGFFFFGFILIVMNLSPKIMIKIKAHAKLRAKGVGRVVGFFSNILTIKLFNQKSFSLNQSDKLFKKSEQMENSLRSWTILQHFTLSILFLAVGCGSMWIIFIDWKKGAVSVGDFALILKLLMDFTGYMWWNARNIGKMTNYIGEIRQILSALPSQMDKYVKNKEVNYIKKPLTDVGCEINFDNITFNYPIKQEVSDKTISSFTLNIPAKQKIGIAGDSGSGKSTLFHLLLSLYKVDSGKILIDKKDISNLSIGCLRSQIGVLSQKAILFNKSIAYNIRYGHLGASDSDVEKAAKMAFAHDFIIQKTNKYNTIVGPGGDKLSGGERQRIVLARVILKNAPILLMDEATAQLDVDSESYITEYIKKFAKDKTAIIIAHRLSTLKDLDRIVVMKKGKIVEEGTHQSLLSKKGYYNQLWNTQVAI